MHTGGTAARRRLVSVLGGPTRTRVVILLACVLALSSADTTTVGASAIQLRQALHINNTDIGLLVSVNAAVSAVFSVPFGFLADHARRTWILGLTTAAWGVAMLWSATAASFGDLLYSRLGLGVVMAASGPTVASLIGDWIPGAERGKVYGYVLSGELFGAGIGFAFTGDIAKLSWRAAFVALAIPAFVLGWLLLRLQEPARGGQGLLLPEPGYEPNPPPSAHPSAAADPGAARRQDAAPTSADEAHRLARAQRIPPDLRLARRARQPMGFFGTVKYVLAVRSNVALIISSACGYFFLSGVETFGLEFVHQQYGIGQVLADLLLLVVGLGAVIGVLAAGPLSDLLLRRGWLPARITVAAVAGTVAVVLFIPALITDRSLTALPFVALAALGLGAQNPPIDAARLDIMPSWLWGRAEGIRTALRTGAQSLAPVLFGVVADAVFGGGSGALKWTFAVMLLPLAASAAFLYGAIRRYPADVATAGAATTGAGTAFPARPRVR